MAVFDDRVMKPIIAWMQAKLSHPETIDEVGQSPEPISTNDFVMPDIYGDDHDATVPDLRIIDLSSSDTDESEGFNPYDTAVFRKK